MVWDMAMATDHNLRDLQVLVPIFLLIAGIIMIMILYFIIIYCENEYIMQVFMHVFCGINYIMHVFWYVSTNDACIYAFSLYLVY